MDHNADTNLFSDDINPFVHKIYLSNLDKLQLLFMSIFVVPFRVLGIFLSLTFMWVVSSVALFGIDNDNVPLDGWRRKCSIILLKLTRSTLFACGYHKIVVKGKHHKQEVPIVVAAPHTTFFDAIVVFGIFDIPTCITRMENKYMPFLGSIVRFMQPIYVSRENANSRSSTVEKLKERVDYNKEIVSGAYWPPIMICPEGTCSNGQALLKFKAGAFIPGVPVQLVKMSHHNRMNTTQWTYVGCSAYKVLWLTLCQFSTYAEVEILPVYIPNNEEIKDPTLFASNVSLVIAKSLGVPASVYSFEDTYLVTYASKLGHNDTLFLLKLQHLFRQIGFIPDNFTLENINYKNLVFHKNDLADLLKCDHTKKVLDDIYNLFLDNSTGIFKLKYFLLNVQLIKKCKGPEELVQAIFQIYSEVDSLNNNRMIPTSSLSILLQDLLRVDKSAAVMFQDTAGRIFGGEKSCFSYDEFKSLLGKNLLLSRFLLPLKSLLKLPAAEEMDINL